MNTPFLNHFNGIHVGAMIDEIDAHTELWSQITARQTTPGSPHHDTESIFLRWAADQSVEAAFTEIRAVDYPALAMLPECSRIMKVLVQQVLGAVEFGRAMLINLKAGGHIDPHVDEGSYADHYSRFHLVMASDPGNEFRCGNESAFMLPGQLWQFDHKLEHEVWNRSARRRIHLVFDAVIR